MKRSVAAIKSLIESKTAPCPITGCWLWFGAYDGRGYGHAWDGEHHVQAHRLSYIVNRGPIPDGLVLDHLCKVRACCNPEHLEPVTFHENLLRSKQASVTHCVNGHEYTPENTYLFKTSGRGRRRCKECNRILKMNEYRRKNPTAKRRSHE